MAGGQGAVLARAAVGRSCGPTAVVTAQPAAGENLVEQLPTGEWIERATYFEAVAVTGDGVFETLRAVSKLVLKSLA